MQFYFQYVFCRVRYLKSLVQPPAHNPYYFVSAAQKPLLLFLDKGILFGSEEIAELFRLFHSQRDELVPLFPLSQNQREVQSIFVYHCNVPFPAYSERLLCVQILDLCNKWLLYALLVFADKVLLWRIALFDWCYNELCPVFDNAVSFAHKLPARLGVQG